MQCSTRQNKDSKIIFNVFCYKHILNLLVVIEIKIRFQYKIKCNMFCEIVILIHCKTKNVISIFFILKIKYCSFVKKKR